MDHNTRQWARGRLRRKRFSRHSRIRLTGMYQMQIFVKIGDGKTITLKVKRSDTIYNVKAKIQDKEGVPAFQQRLMFDDKLLVGSCTLEDHGILEGSTLTLNLVLQGIHIFLKTLTGRIMTFEVERADTVFNVKAKIFDEHGIVPAQQHIVFAGKELEEDHTLADYGIDNNCILHFVVCTGKQISVKTPTGRAVIDCFTTSSVTVGHLKTQIHDMLCIPWRRGSGPLENDCVFAHTRKLWDRVELVLQLRLPGGQ
uniref:Uncharacterized protein n=1 Tax=Avena sativa TaxID=4498 RepID=A0ACD5TSY1_AVESA